MNAGGSNLEELGRDDLFVLAREFRDGTSRLVKRPLNGRAPARVLAALHREREILAGLDIDGVARLAADDGSDAELLLDDPGGRTLRAALAEGALPLRDALRAGAALARTLAALHAAGIAHRALRPDCVLFDADRGRVTLTDFAGASRLRQGREMPRPPRLLGVPLAYVAPEQTGRMNRLVDDRSDLYSLGVTLYELLVGRPPFASDDPLELVHWHLARSPAALSSVAPGVPRVVSDIVLRLLAKNAEERYQTASGLQADLERALDRDGPFPLGLHDAGDVFTIPQKLYGREAETALLLAAFERARHGRATLMLVSGYSGIGKTSLVNEVHKPIAGARGRFAAGKFDQLDRNVPYGALVTALRALVQQLLAEGEGEIARCRERVLAALGHNAGVMTAVVPNLALLVGDHPPPPPLGPTEARNRFNFVFQDFLGALAAPEHPLALFLDDLQWADSATLTLLPLLLANGALRNVFLIGAYRDNEVSPDHPLMRTLREARAAGAVIDELSLTPLDAGHVTALVQDALRCPLTPAQRLAALVLRKTAGNPFFLTQFLTTLHAGGLLVFDRAAGAWTFDAERIEQAQMTDNVIVLMTARLKQLSDAARRRVTLGAAIGNTFTLRTLALASESGLREAADELWEAIALGLVLPLTPRYELLSAASDDVLGDARPVFRFLHDRVQQAAYELIPAGERAAVHLRVGRLLRAACGSAVPPEQLFEIANHLNLGAALITDAGERLDLARLDLAAGRRAKESAAYPAALEYFERGRRLLPAVAWTTHEDLARDLELEAGECAYLCGRFDEAEQCLDAVLAHARTAVDRAEACRVRIVQYENTARFHDAVRVGRATLAEFGVVLPDDEPGKAAALARELEHIEALRAGRPIASLAALDTMQDPPMRSVMRLLMSLWAPAYIAPDAPLAALISATMVRLSLEHGNCEESAYGHVTHGINVGTGLGDFRSGHEFGRLAIAVNERFHDVKRRAKVQHMFSCFVNLWREPLESCFPYSKEAYRAGVETGDLTYATYAIFHESWYALLSGMDLGRFAREYGPKVSFLRRIRNDSFAEAQQMLLHWGRCLAGETAGPVSLSSAEFDETAFERAYGANAFFMTFYWVPRVAVRYAFGAYDDALACAARAGTVVASLTGTIWPVLLSFYTGLALAAREPDGETAAAREARGAEVAVHAAGLARYAENAPANFLHMQRLLEAEAARLARRTGAAVAAYEAAHAAAEAAGRVPDVALAQELFAGFWLERGNALLARPLLEAARAGYARWGAAGKVRDLERRHAALLADARAPREGDASPGDGPGLVALDFETARRAAHAITAEIELDPLLVTLVRLAVENAGADGGALAQEIDGSLRLVATGSVAGGEVLPRPPLPVAEAAGAPAGPMHVVWRTGEPLLVHDAERDAQWCADPYVVASRPRSMLCVPILHQGRRRGVLYVENRLAAGAFTVERVEMMRFLAGEAGLALENATLYEALREALREVERLKNRLQEENVYLQEEIRTEHNFEEIVGRSPLLVAALRKIEQVAATDATVLILGETGTGKELFARAIHDRSPRKERPLVKVNCGSIPAGLVESELFGHVKGAFTGALQHRTGRFQLAHGGTLFLDEVGELPPDTQVKLLRVLQEQEFEPVGSSRTVRVDVRVIAATNRDLEEAVRGGSFRADLLYRLNVFPIEIPPLRDRADDVSLLAAFFLARVAKRLGKPVESFSRQSVRRMLEYPWPGNVRELQNIVERAVILADGPLAEVDARLLAGVAPQVLDQRARTLEQLERAHIVETLRATGGVIEGPRGAARILDVNPNTLRSRMKKLGIDKPARSGGPGLAGHDIS